MIIWQSDVWLTLEQICANILNVQQQIVHPNYLFGLSRVIFLPVMASSMSNKLLVFKILFILEARDLHIIFKGWRRSNQPCLASS